MGKSIVWNNLAIKLILVFTIYVIILILMSENNFKHGRFYTSERFKYQQFFEKHHNIVKFSNKVKTYLDNYFNQKVLNETEILVLAEQDTNIALKYIREWNQNYSKINVQEFEGLNLKTCDVKPPPAQTIHMNNIYWQSVVNSQDLNLYSYNAYYDKRQATNKIRVIAISDHFNKLINTTLWCLLYFEGQKRSVLSEVIEINELAYDFKNFYKRKDYYLPVLLTCDIPNDLQDSVPKAVAIKTNSNCWELFNNLLRVIYDNQGDNQERFGVCVRALNYHSSDYSLRLLEWLELIKILGAHKVFLYSFTVHPNMEKVVNYYLSKNFIDWKHSTHAGKQLNHKFLDEIYIKRMGDLLLPQETLELNDCLYRNIYNYEYLVLLDIDEIIVPVKSYNWNEMLVQIHNSSIITPDKKRFGSYLFTQTRFYNGLVSEEFNSNEYLYTMRHLHRANFTNNAPKAFHLTKNIKIIWNHSGLKCINQDKCPLHWVKKGIGYLAHYRPGIEKPKNCSSQDLKSCAKFDTILVKYNKILETNMKIALNEIFG